MSTRDGIEVDSRLAEIQKLVRKLPRNPGVYLMRDDTGNVIYVGKAKDLKVRVRTYFQGGDGRYQIQYLVKRVFKIDTIVTDTEEQAFILERDLITKYKPRFNIRLKDDKAYLCIRIDTNAAWPRIELVRKIKEDGAKYFGPYAFSYELRALLEVIKRVIPLRSCSDNVFYNRQRPCLEYQIKRCAGPCTLPVDKDRYADWLNQAIAILEGKTKSTIKHLSALMDDASENLRFEEAAAWRDRIEILKNFESGHNLISHRGESRDVFSIFREDRHAGLCVLLVRGGRIADSRTFSLGEVVVPDEEVIESCVGQFYESNEIPEEIIVPCELPNQRLVKTALGKKKGRAVEISIPFRGSKLRLLKIAELNAKQHYLASNSGDTEWAALSQDLAQLLKLSQLPRRVECVDISNFQGAEIVGAVVNFFDGTPEKSGYRKYIVSSQGKPDDFASIHEVVSRRLARGLEEGDLPDLLIIDGGPGQLSMACKARDEHKLSLDIVALAKMKTESDLASKVISQKPERIHLERGEVIELDPHKPVTRFFQRIRDEVHRFVITFHRSRRGKRAVHSVLDDISGLGPERRGRLLRHYGTVEAIKAADPSELAKIGRMPRPLADKVLKAVRLR